MNGQCEKFHEMCTCGAAKREDGPTARPASRRGSLAVGADNELRQSAIAGLGPHVCFTEAPQAPVASSRATGPPSRRASSAKRSSSLPPSSTRRASPAKRARSSRQVRSPRRRSVSRSTKTPKVRRRRSLPRKRRQTVDYSGLPSDWIYQYAFSSPSSPQYPPQSNTPALAPNAGVAGQYQPSSLGQAQALTVLPVVPQVQMPVLLPTSPPFKVIPPPRLLYRYSERQMHTSFLPQPDPPGWDSVLRFSLAVAGASILILTIVVAMYIIVISKREPTEADVFASVTPPWLGHI